jgi:DNA-binding transcriptional ArsR family regulator
MSTGDWSFLTSHARALLCIAIDSELRLRDLADALDVTERTAYGIVMDLTEAGYLVKQKEGRRNRYQIQDHLPLPDGMGMVSQRTIGEVLGLLLDVSNDRGSSGPRSTRRRSTDRART